MKFVIATTGASGALYLQRLMDQLDAAAHEIHFVWSAPARAVLAAELGGELELPKGVRLHDEEDMAAPYVSGSALFDAMVILPCSMGTLGRIAAGTSDSALLRAADVFLKEKRRLILCPRETPWSLIHARNAVAVLEAGAVLLPACPSFYGRPASVEAVVDTVVARVLDHLGLPNPRAHRWGEPS